MEHSIRRVKTWENITSEANTDFFSEKWSSALEKYELSLELAWQRFNEHRPTQYETALNQILVSYFNITDTYLKLDKQNEALKQFEDCFYFLDIQISNTNLDRAREISILNFYAQARSEWLLFRQKTSDRSYKNPTGLNSIAKRYKNPIPITMGKRKKGNSTQSTSHLKPQTTAHPQQLQ